MTWHTQISERDAAELRDINTRLSALRRIMAQLTKRRNFIVSRAKPTPPKKPKQPRFL